MPTNIEIKARLNDVPAAHALLVTISDTPPQTLHQRDTFFRCARGRLKLREMGPGHGELIFYDRPDAAAAKRSDYEIVAVGDPEVLRGVLARALGVTQTVVKTRVLGRIGPTRVHLDSVEGLGDFLELEFVLRPGQDPAEGQAGVADLMGRLGVREHDLCSASYADMLAAAASRPSTPG